MCRAPVGIERPMRTRCVTGYIDPSSAHVDTDCTVHHPLASSIKESINIQQPVYINSVHTSARAARSRTTSERRPIYGLWGRGGLRAVREAVSEHLEALLEDPL